MIEKFLIRAEENGWRVETFFQKAVALPEDVIERYTVPKEYSEFLSNVKLCSNPSDTKWFLCADDYGQKSEDEFRWNEFEIISLEAAGDDAELKASIRAFWDVHFPFFMSVESGYEYYAIDIRDCSVVFGSEPEFEDVVTVARSFEEFLEGMFIEKSPQQWVLIEDEAENEAIWNEFNDLLGFAPDLYSEEECPFDFSKIGVPVSCYDISGISALDFEAQDEDCNYRMTEQIAILRSAFVDCMGADEYMYALDWQHSCFKFDPRVEAAYDRFMMYSNSPDSRAYYPDFHPNGDYFFFVAKDLSWGYLTHPWQRKVWFYGSKLTDLIKKHEGSLGFKAVNFPSHKMNFIDKIMAQLDAMSADDVVQSIGGDIYRNPGVRENLHKYPQFVRDIVSIIDLDTALSMDGDVLVNNIKDVPQMITALRNIRADVDADCLQRIRDAYQTNSDHEAIKEIADRSYDDMYFNTGHDIWSLLNAYVEKEKHKQ